MSSQLSLSLSLILVSYVFALRQVEIEDFVWDELKRVYHYPCPCGDRFEITKGDLRDGEDIAKCPSCSLLVRVIYDQVSTALLPGRSPRRAPASSTASTGPGYRRAASFPTSSRADHFAYLPTPSFAARLRGL